jgi:hypothetical protein
MADAAAAEYRDSGGSMVSDDDGSDNNTIAFGPAGCACAKAFTTRRAYVHTRRLPPPLCVREQNALCDRAT